MSAYVPKLVRFEKDSLRLLYEVCERSGVGFPELIRTLVADYLAVGDRPQESVLTEIADLRNLVREGVELSAAAIAAVLVFNDDSKLSEEQASERSRKMLANAMKLVPAIRRSRVQSKG